MSAPPGPLDRIAAVVLAAGGSRRLGSPKQLVRYRGEPLVHRAARAAIEAGLAPVVVVVSVGAEPVRAAVADLPVETVDNPRSATGMASSVQAGVAHVLALAPDVSGVALVACDQPLLDGKHLRALADLRRRTGKQVIGSEYGGVIGVPVILAAEVLEEVRTLAGDAGARDLVRRDPRRMAAVPFPGGEVDVDRAEDVAALTGRDGKGDAER